MFVTSKFMLFSLAWVQTGENLTAHSQKNRKL
uniref:Uncharacterized protein n=1 Tax=Anguilla anguilla TaxID=7936 RepID=A0A0E9TPX2_ANGAN